MPPHASPGASPLRVGQIRFLNCLPLYWGLRATGPVTGPGSDLELRPDTPDRLSDLLVAGELDVGPVSLVEYLRHAGRLALLPDLAVGADGPVLSVALVSARPLAALDGATVALGTTSRTSVVLARLLLEERYRVRPRYVAAPPDLAAMLQVADAAVVIGDPALVATVRARSGLPPVDLPTDGGEALGVHDLHVHDLHVHDLAALWQSWTGLPMVFAVWCATDAAVAARPQDVVRVADRFRRSLALAAEHRTEVLAAAVAASGLPQPVLADYFAALDFSLGERQLAGLAEFARRSAPITGAPAEVRPRWLPDLR